MRVEVKVESSIWSEKGKTYYRIESLAGEYSGLQGFVDSKHMTDVLAEVRKRVDNAGYTVSGKFEYNEDRNLFQADVEKKRPKASYRQLINALKYEGLDVRPGDTVELIPGGLGYESARAKITRLYRPDTTEILGD